MNYHVLTLFPEMIEQGLSNSITGRALKKNIITLSTVNIRDYSNNKHKKVDDYTYGGGAGMLMQAQPVYDAVSSVLSSVPENNTKRVIYVTPQGSVFNQKKAMEFSKEDDLIFLCGHYEGIDERVLEEVVTDYVSIGDYILTGGELPAMVMIDAISRLVPGVLHNEVSAETESFHGNLLEYPQYSRPEEWHGKAVPEVLLSGNQKKIDEWRLLHSIERTKQRRPDLFKKYQILQDAKELLLGKKLLHIDMIEMINNGEAEVIEHQGQELLLRNVNTGIYYHSNLLLEDGESVCFGKPFEDAGIKIAEFSLDTAFLVAHTKEASQKAVEKWNMTEIADCYLVTYTMKEKAPVTGLYRPDGKPMEGGNAEGLYIRPLGVEHAELVMEANPDTDEYYLESQIRQGQMVGAFIDDVLVGMAGYNDCGDVGLLFVYPNYRRRGIGKALFTYMINDCLEKGRTPYCMFDEKDMSVIGLFEALGMYRSKTPVFWLYRN